MQQPTVLTIILNYRTAEMTLKSAAAALDAMQGIEGEVVIVDNDSGDGSFDVIDGAIARHGWDRNRISVVQTEHNGGFGAGNNFGIQRGLSNGARPDFVYLLNSDAFPERGAIRALLDHLRAHPDAGMAGSYIHGPDGDPHCTAFRYPTMASEFEGAIHTGFVSRLLKNATVPLPIPREPTNVDWVAGASVLMRGTMLAQVGLFDERFFLYFEETDLCLRAKRQGWRVIYVPSSSVIHIGSVSTGMKVWKRTPGYWFDSRLHYFTKNHSRTYALAATALRVVAASIWRIRIRFNDRPLGDPPGFLQDLIAHTVRSFFLAKPNSETRPTTVIPQAGGQESD